VAEVLVSGIRAEQRGDGWHLVAVCDNEQYSYGPMPEAEVRRFGRQITQLTTDFAEEMERHGAPKSQHFGAALRVVLEEIGVPIRPPPPPSRPFYETARRLWNEFEASDAKAGVGKVES